MILDTLHKHDLGMWTLRLSLALAAQDDYAYIHWPHNLASMIRAWPFMRAGFSGLGAFSSLQFSLALKTQHGYARLFLFCMKRALATDQRWLLEKRQRQVEEGANRCVELLGISRLVQRSIRLRANTDSHSARCLSFIP